MKYFLGITVLFLLSCAQNAKQLEAAISYGEIKELNEYSTNVEKQLFVRLFRAPASEGSCFSETEGVCQYRYFLSVSTFDEQPETTIFPLELRGEVVDVKWTVSSAIDTANIIFTVNKYTSYAVTNNSKLIQNQTKVKLLLSLSSATETTM